MAHGLPRKEDFPALGSYKAYLNTAAIGIPPRSSVEAGIRVFEAFLEDPYRADYSIASMASRVADALSRLYGVSPESVGVSVSTTECIARTALGLAGPGGVIGVTSMEFPGITYALSTGCGRVGCRVRMYGGGVEDAVLEAIDNGVDVVVFSSVAWVTGERPDLEKIAARAAERGVYTIVDAIQHLGALTLPPDPAGKLDMIAGAVKKWLLAPHSNTAVCIVGGRLLDETPLYYSLNNTLVEDKDAYWRDPRKDILNPPPPRRDAHRYTIPSGLSSPSLAAAAASIEYLAGIGVEAIEEHVLSTAKKLAGILEHYDLQPLIPRPESGIVTATLGDPRRDDALSKCLQGEGVRHSVRGQASLRGLRFSVHLYNGGDDLAVLEEALGRCSHL